MRCECCNNVLTPFEESFKSAKTHRTLNICEKCYNTISDDVLIVADTSLEHEDGTDFADLIDNLLDDDYS